MAKSAKTKPQSPEYDKKGGNFKMTLYYDRAAFSASFKRHKPAPSQNGPVV